MMMIMFINIMMVMVDDFGEVMMVMMMVLIMTSSFHGKVKRKVSIFSLKFRHHLKRVFFNFTFMNFLLCKCVLKSLEKSFPVRCI